MTTQESVSVKDAFGAAVEEEGLGELSDDTSFYPDDWSDSTEADEQADSGSEDQPEEVDTDTGDELLDLLVEEGDDESEEEDGDTFDVGSDDFWEEVVEVDFGDGAEEVTLQQLLDGNMKSRDYTQKTQVLAEEREQAEQAINFHEAFMQDPQGVLRFLMQEVGGADGLEEGSVTEVDLGVRMSPEEMEEEVERRVDERLDDDPNIEQARVSAATAEMEGQFSDIEGAFDVSLSLDNKRMILDTARDRGHTDLYSTYAMLRSEAERVRGERSHLARGGTPRRSGAAPKTANAAPEISTVSDAFDLASDELRLR